MFRAVGKCCVCLRREFRDGSIEFTSWGTRTGVLGNLELRRFALQGSRFPHRPHRTNNLSTCVWPPDAIHAHNLVHSLHFEALLSPPGKNSETLMLSIVIDTQNRKTRTGHQRTNLNLQSERLNMFKMTRILICMFLLDKLPHFP